MVERHSVRSVVDFIKLVRKLEGKTVFAFFCGSKTGSGVSWCPDCIIAETVVERILASKSDEDFHYIEVDVGDKPAWRNPENPFRKDKRFGLKSIPTLMRWGGSERLGEKDFSDPARVEAVFSTS